MYFSEDIKRPAHFNADSFTLQRTIEQKKFLSIEKELIAEYIRNQIDLIFSECPMRLQYRIKQTHVRE